MGGFFFWYFPISSELIIFWNELMPPLPSISGQSPPCQGSLWWPSWLGIILICVHLELVLSLFIIPPTTVIVLLQSFMYCLPPPGNFVLHKDRDHGGFLFCFVFWTTLFPASNNSNDDDDIMSITAAAANLAVAANTQHLLNPRC